MEALLPSEISRLILGYLEEQSCTSAYQTFLETCPHLKECAEAAQQGMRFSTRAAGKSLRDILNEYCLIFTIVQERIQKLPDSTASQLKAYGVSLADQVKQLIDGKQTGQRFHVNITVPSQPKSSKARHVGAGVTHSPCSSHHMVTPTSSRMRRTCHPIQEQRLTLRSQDSKEDVTASVTVQRVETTQLENLPGSSADDSPNNVRPIRRVSLSVNRDHSIDSEYSTNNQEENESFLDPKTGELISPVARQTDLRPAVKETKSCSNVVSKTVEKDSSVPSASSVKPSKEPHDGSKASVVDRPSSGNHIVQNVSGSERTSLDRMLINILSTHGASDSAISHDKSANSIADASAAVSRRSDSNVVPHGEISSSEQPTIVFAAPIAGTSIQDQVTNESCIHTSPAPKEPQKNVHEAEAATPRRSAAKRKTKPTPLKMMTPLKIKVGGESTDSPDVKINPKLIYGPLLEKRELHERIAENINQYIRPSSTEEVVEQREENTAEAAADAVLSTSSDGKAQPSKDLSTQEELEKVIKSVVDKTESDPLFESLLCDILGPDCNEDSLMDSLIEGKSTHDLTSIGEHETNETRPPDDGKKDPISILEDQNEAAIKSILEAQPTMKDTPNPKQGKTSPKRKGKQRVPRRSKAKNEKEVPGAFIPITADFDIRRKKRARQAGGAAAANVNEQANGEEGHRVIILPLQDILVPPLNCPTIIFNGLPHLASQRPRPIPIAPKDPVNVMPGNPPFTLTKVNSEDARKMNLMRCSNSNAVAVPPSDPILSVDLRGHADTLQPLPSVDPNDIQVSALPLENEDIADSNIVDECVSGAVESSTCIQGSTPDILASRPTRAATEGQKKLMEKQGDTPLMPTGKPRVSMSTPRRKSRGHVRALDFGSTPPKPLPLTLVESATKVLTTSTPYDIPKTYVGTRPLQSSVSLNPARKELCLGGPGMSTLPDLSTTCIATRSPPPQLSGAWNKVGVDLIFGCDTSPTSDQLSPRIPGQNVSESNEPPQENVPELDEAPKEGSKDGVKDSSKDSTKDGTKNGSRGSPTSTSPMSKLKAEAWDAALRAQLCFGPEPPKLTRSQRRAIARMEKRRKNAEENKVVNEFKREQLEEAKKAAEEAKKKRIEERNAKKAQKAEAKSLRAEAKALKADAKTRRKSGGPARSKFQSQSSQKEAMPLLEELESSGANENPPVGKEAKESVVEEENESNVLIMEMDATSEDELIEVDGVAVGDKRKRDSTGEEPAKKKMAAEPRASLELNSPRVVPVETVTSPDKAWVVQQSPGSWANKRSLHSQNLDLEEGKFSSSNLVARRCLDLHETPRKPEVPTANEIGTLPGAGNTHAAAGDRATLTVVDTPLFPPTPGMGVHGTPPSQDSGEAVDAFPNYFKPREKSGAPSKENQVEDKISEDVGNGAALPKSQTGDTVQNYVRKSGDVSKGAEKSDQEAGITGRVEDDSMEDFVVAENTATVVKKNAKTKKTPVQKTPAVPVKSQDKPKEKSNAEEEEGSDPEKEDGDSDVPPTRVLRPRKKTANYKGESPRGDAKGVATNEPESQVTTKRKSLPKNNESESQVNSKRKSLPRRRKKQPSPEPEPCNTVPEEEITEGLVFKPVAPEVVATQSQEAEILAKQIKLKLSPLNAKSSDVEEEEDDGDSTKAIGSPSGEVEKIVDQKGDGDSEKGFSKGDESSMSECSSSSDSSSSESSAEDDAEHDNVLKSGVSSGAPDEAVGKLNDSSKSKEKQCPVEESKSVTDGSQSRKPLSKKDEVSKLQTSTPVDETAEKNDGKKLFVIQWKKGNDTEASGSCRSKQESDKLGQSQNMNVHERKDLSKNNLLLSEKKKRRDNLEKILFGRDSNDAEESIGALESPSTLLPLTDHSLATELEMKKQRTLEKLKGGKASPSSGALGGAGINSSPSPTLPTRISSVVVTPKALSFESPGKRAGNFGTQRSPRKSIPVKESSKIMSIFDGEDDEFQDDCPELRLSEGEFEFDTPEKIIVSPDKFELLASVEDKLALMHGDITASGKKKTARMSCTPASLHSGESLQKSDLSKTLNNASNNAGKTADPGSKETGNVSQPLQQPDPIPSTSKAAELRHKAEERKFRAAIQGLTASNNISGVTVRKKYPERQRRSLRSNQLEAGNEDMFRGDESGEVNKEPNLNHENRVVSGENCEEEAEGSEKSKCLRSSPRKSRENEVLQASTESESEKTNQKDMPKGSGRSAKALESQPLSNKDTAQRDGAVPEPCINREGNSAGPVKQNKRQAKKCEEEAAELERSKAKPSRSRRKSGYVQNRGSEDGKSLLLDLNEDELTRDGFDMQTNESGSTTHCQPHTSIGSLDIPFQKKLEVSKNSVLNEKCEKQNFELKKVVESGSKPQKSVCDVPKSKSSGKKVGANKRKTSPTRAKVQKNTLDPDTVDANEVREKLLEDAKKLLQSAPKESSRKSFKNAPKSSQMKLPDPSTEDKSAPLDAPSKEVGRGASNAQKSLVKVTEKADGDQVYGNLGNDVTPPQNHTEEQGGQKNARDSNFPHQSPASDSSEAPSGGGGALSDNSEDVNVGEGGCSEAPTESCANNSSLVGASDMSFSSNEAYITIVYDEENPPKSTPSILMSELGPPLSPSAPELEGLTVELDGEVVTITKSDYIELFSYTPKEIPSQVSRGVRAKVISAILSSSKKPKNDQDKEKVVSKKKKDNDTELKQGIKGGSLSSDRKRKQGGDVEQVKVDVPSKLSRPSCRKDKEVPQRNSRHTESLNDRESKSIQRVVDTCNVSNENSVDDDSLMTYAAIGSVCTEENQNKEHEGTRKFLPLKKRRTTTEDTPVKSQGDGDVGNTNPGMFFPLNVMEIEDFLSKVHGDGS